MGDEDLDDVSDSEEVFNKQKPKNNGGDDSSGRVGNSSDDDSDSGDSSINMDGDEDDE